MLSLTTLCAPAKNHGSLMMKRDVVIWRREGKAGSRCEPVPDSDKVRYEHRLVSIISSQLLLCKRPPVADVLSWSPGA